MIDAFHAAGIEVILDVVHNHTGEGEHGLPAVSLRRCRRARTGAG